jgi:hypothetical protein
MTDAVQRIAELEWVNYASILATNPAIPGFRLEMREEVILTSSEFFPTQDTTHACLLRSTPETVEPLLTEVTGYFQSKGLPINIFLSPACTPADLPARLLDRGFVKQATEESWMVFEHLLDAAIPTATIKIPVRRIQLEEASTFATIFLTAHGLPVEFAPMMAQLLEPGITSPDVYLYLAFIDGQPAAVCAFRCYQSFGVYGSGAVLPAYRGSRAISNLFITAAQEAQKRGVDTVLLQTAAGAPLERMLRISGFKRVFTRVGYTLHAG